jgi:hypothetical protein
MVMLGPPLLSITISPASKSIKTPLLGIREHIPELPFCCNYQIMRQIEFSDCY